MRLTPRGRRLANTLALLAFAAALWAGLITCYAIGTR